MAATASPVDVNTTVAEVWPWLLSVAVNAAVPVAVMSVAVSAPSVPWNPGSTRVTLSPWARAAVHLNAYVISDVVDVSPTAMVKALALSVGAANAVDEVILAVAISGDAAMVTAAVLVARFTACTAAVVASPVAMVMAHAVSLEAGP